MESLFAQFDHSSSSHDPIDTRTAISSLLEILGIFTRSDIKREVLKEIERLNTALSRMQGTPHIDTERLNSTISELADCASALHGLSGRIGHNLKENDFLVGIRQRSSIPGGTCDFDLPAYHYWLTRSPDIRIRDLRAWISEFDAIRQGFTLITKLLRESAEPTKEHAIQGFFQRSLDSNAAAQLIRVGIPDNSIIFPEISAGKHRFTIRFLRHTLKGRPSQISDDIEFTLMICQL